MNAPVKNEAYAPEFSSVISVPFGHTSTHPDFEYRKAQLSELPFLAELTNLLDDDIEVFVARDSAGFRRTDADGAFMMLGRSGGHEVAVIWHDFRIAGGSYGKRLSERMKAFLEQCDAAGLPLVAKISSVGVRFMEGRTVFDNAFSLVPALLTYREHNLVITVAHGQTVGLGALAFRLGHYRIAVEEKTFVSLTGPQVCELTFGKDSGFEEMACTATEFEKSDTISETIPELDGAMARAKVILAASYGDPEAGVPVACDDDQTREFMRGVCDRVLEIYPGRDDRLRVFIAWCGDRQFGIFANPVENVQNMVRVRTLDLFEDALALFEHLGLPLLSLVDTPGADPRADDENRRIITRLVEVGGKIINYPHARIGIVAGRAYGGASILGFPKVFGGLRSYALNTARVGIMHAGIIGALLNGSPRLQKQWAQVSKSQRVDMQDMIDAGALDAVISPEEMRGIVERELLDAHDAAVRDDWEAAVPAGASAALVLQQH
ncbi:MAG: carboxyl transferase domain-containing protein [Pseudomonadota bacterium]